MNIDAAMLEILAEAVHNHWMTGKLRDGWKYGSVTDEAGKIHSCLVPYEQLSDANKESDRNIARSIPEILRLAGYRIVPNNKI